MSEAVRVAATPNRETARARGAAGDLRPIVLLVAIVLATLLVWVQGAQWGHPYAFHSDEIRYLSRVVEHPSVPIWTVYGRWPIYFQRVAAWLTGRPASDLVLARVLSALVSAAALMAVARAAALLNGWRSAFVALSLIAGAPVVVQSAHFFITDVWLYAFVASALLFCFRVVERGGWVDSVAIGLCWGIAAGSKLSGVFLLPAVVLAHILRRQPHRARRLAAVCAIAAGVTLVGQPTLWLHGLPAYLQQGELLVHLEVAAGTYLPAYTLQFANTSAWTYYWSPLLLWGAAPLLLAAGSVGGMVALWHVARHFRGAGGDRAPDRLLIALVVFATFYLMSAGQYSKYVRYVLPLLPPLAVLGGWGLSTFARRFNPRAQVAALGMIAAVGYLPGLAVAQMYTRPDTRLQAADWVGDHIPGRSVICHEPDVGYAVPPIGLGGPAYGATATRDYTGILLDWGLLYNASDYLRQHQAAPISESPDLQALRTQAQQRAQIESWLAQCDWIILSDRFADQYLPLPEDFQAISSLYDDLLSHRRADFVQAAEFRSLPGLWGVSVDDRSSELTFRSFDHPTIWIFRRK